MSDGRSEGSTPARERSCTSDWPSFALRYTFNPDRSVRSESFDADELFVFDPTRIAESNAHWISAERGSYVSVEDVR